MPHPTETGLTKTSSEPKCLGNLLYENLGKSVLKMCSINTDIRIRM